VTSVYLARHGETDANAEGRVQGWMDPPLNAQGRRQAERLARECASLGLRALYTSHLRRAHETAVVVGERIGLEPRVDERLAESRRGAWEGRLLGELERDEPETWAAWRAGGPDFRFPGGGESLAEHAERVDAALAEIAAAPTPALAVCHGGTIRCALATRRPEGLTAFNTIAVPNGALVPLPHGSA
jgi:broad specificity phosphatase PhoE